MIDKTVPDLRSAVSGIQDGATVMIGGFGNAGMPKALIDALIEQGASDLTIVNNNAGNGDAGLAALLAAGRVKKIICSFPRQSDSHVFDALYRAGKIELELTVDDPKAYTKPWTVKMNQILQLDTDLIDYVCLENEKDLSHYVGPLANEKK